MTKEISIGVQNLNYSFGKGALSKQILFDVTTNIYAGEIVIVTGPSGSGKTTLLTILSALRSIKDGQVQVLGQELKGANNKILEHVRQNIGFIFQQHNLVAALTAQQNVMLGLNVSKKFKGPELSERAKHYLHSVGLGERLHYYPEQLSGGQRQRVAIARALASEPKLLMADEPTASLDKQSGRDVVDRMKVMAKEHGTTILLVTHDNRILDIADRIVYLEDGRLSNFNQAVIDNSQQMMRIVADSHSDERDDQKGNNFEYQQLIAEISLEAQRIVALYGKLNPMAYRSVVIEGIQNFSDKIRQKLNVQMLLLFLAGSDDWQLIPFDGRSFADDVNYPLGKGLVAATKKQGKVLRIENVRTNNDYDHELDQLLQINTESVISAPLFRSSGECFAVLQIRNRVDGAAFNAEDEKNFSLYVASISVLVETYHNISNGE